MDSPSQRASSDPCLCAGGCGFYGNSDTHGFCSVCYKAQQSTSLAAATASSPSPAAVAAAAAVAEPAPAPAAEPMLAEPAPAPEQASPAVAAAAEPAAASAAADASEPGDDEKPVQENRGRCFCCRKKIGLLGFECRCGYVFCSGHRHAQDHACAFDFVTMQRAHLAKANTKVVAAKVDKL